MNFSMPEILLFTTTTPAPAFPERFESLSISIIYAKVREFAGHFNIAAFIIKVPIFIFFCYHIIKRTKNICNVYFCLLMIGFFWDILDAMIYSVFLMTCTSDEECPILMRANKLSFWYNTDLSGIWTLALTINRLTAIVWWQKYDEIWSKNFKYCFAFLSIYPFLLHGYSFIDYKCRLELELDQGKKCEEYWLEDAKVTSISSIIVAVISFFTDMITVTIYRIKIKKDNALKKNPDKKLIYQAIISSFLFVLYTAIFQYWAFLRDELKPPKVQIGIIYTIAYGGMHYSYIAFHGSGFILIFFISPNLRKHLLKFYHLTWIYKIFPSTKRLLQISSTHKSNTTTNTNTNTTTNSNTLIPVT